MASVGRVGCAAGRRCSNAPALYAAGRTVSILVLCFKRDIGSEHAGEFECERVQSRLRQRPFHVFQLCILAGPCLSVFLTACCSPVVAPAFGSPDGVCGRMGTAANQQSLRGRCSCLVITGQRLQYSGGLKVSSEL